MAAEFPGERDVPWDKMSPQAEAALSLMAEVIRSIIILINVVDFDILIFSDVRKPPLM